MRAFLTAFIVFVSSYLIMGQPKASLSTPFVQDEVLVKFDVSLGARLPEAANRAVGAHGIENLGDTGWQRLKVPDGMSVDDTIASYRSIYGVESAQPNFLYHQLAMPNDPLFAGGMYGLTKISAPAAWDLTTGSSSVVVADIDSGIRYTHPDLAANIWTNPGEIQGNGVDDDGNGFVDDYYGWDFRFNDADPIDIDGASSSVHGTHTAGTIGAVGNNLIGVVGVNWNVKIMNVKIFNNQVSDDTTSAMLVNAYNYILMMKKRGVNIRVTNNSYGGCTEACGYDQATKDAIDAVGDAGVLNVFSAGNDASNSDAVPSYPASYTSPSVVAVAASDSNDNKAGFSNYGITSTDLAAPGVGIVSTLPTNGYGSLSGTSMAGPHVAGAAALLSAYNPSLTPASLKATLLNNVDVLANWAGVVRTGGRLNVDRALRNQTVCTYNTRADLTRRGARGHLLTLRIGAVQNCDYVVKSGVSWITVLDQAPFSGGGVVRLKIANNNQAAARTGTIMIGEQTMTVRQNR